MRVLQLILDASKHFIRRDCLNKSAILAYTTMFSLVPILIVMLYVISTLPIMDEFSGKIEHFLLSNILIENQYDFQFYIKHFIEQARDLSTLGLLFLFISSFILFFNIVNAFDQICLVIKSKHSFIYTIFFMLFLLLFPLLILSVVLIEYYVINFFSDTFWILNIYTFLISIVMFSVFYKIIPGCKVRFHSAIIGGVFSASLFVILRKIFVFYFSYVSNYTILYGAMAAIPVFMLWIYFSWAIILFGLCTSYIVENSTEKL